MKNSWLKSNKPSCLTTTFGDSHWIIIFLGLQYTGSCGAAWNITLLLAFWYGNHRSVITACGLLGTVANLSTITFLGGGGSLLPEIVIIFWPTAGGSLGGASRTTKGSGVHGLGGCWRITSGGAGGNKIFGSYILLILSFIKLFFFIEIYLLGL